MPPLGIALVFILIPVFGSEVCVRRWCGTKRKDMGQVHHGVYDESSGEWVTLGMRKRCNTTQTS